MKHSARSDVTGGVVGMRKLFAGLVAAGSLLAVPGLASAASAPSTAVLQADATALWARSSGLPACPAGVPYYAGGVGWGTLCVESVNVRDVDTSRAGWVSFVATDGYVVSAPGYQAFYSNSDIAITVPS